MVPFVVEGGWVTEMEGGEESSMSRERYKGRSDRWYEIDWGFELDVAGGEERVGGVVERSRKRS